MNEPTAYVVTDGNRYFTWDDKGPMSSGYPITVQDFRSARLFLSAEAARSSLRVAGSEGAFTSMYVAPVYLGMAIPEEKHNAMDWATKNGFIIRDADGFRKGDGVDIYTELTYDEWEPRALEATIQVVNTDLFKKYLERVR